jgi:ribosomal protein S18 acetylase RimI-like enzyme
MASTIRFARRGDLARLLPLVEAYYKFDSIAFDRIITGRALRRLLRDPSLGRAWIVEAGRIAVGYAILTYNYDLEFGGMQGIITDMYVGPRYRRKGLGAKLIAAICDCCRADDIDAVELQVTASNRRAQSFYRALGFKRADRIVMGLDLKPHSRLFRQRAIART